MTSPNLRDFLYGNFKLGSIVTSVMYELYRGLQDVGVPSKLVIYKGFEGIGHGPSKPKSSRAVMQHNLEWFDRYIFTGPTTTTSQESR